MYARARLPTIGAQMNVDVCVRMRTADRTVRFGARTQTNAPANK